MPNGNREIIDQLMRQTRVQDNVIEELKVRISMLENINQQQCLSTDLANTTYCFILAELTRIMKLKDDEIREKDQKLAAIQEILNKKTEAEDKTEDGKKDGVAETTDEQKKDDNVLDSLD